MPKVIQIRDVPDDVHAALARAAASRGLSLTRYMAAQLEELARREEATERNAAVIRTVQQCLTSHPDRASILAVLGEDALAAPHLIDSEVTHVLRRLALRGELTAEDASLAMAAFMQLTLTRFPAEDLRVRMWSLRHNLSADDATYAALTEQLDATLLTTDARLAHATGPQCRIDIL